MTGPEQFVPPNSPQAEGCVIGGLLMDNRTWTRVHGMLRVRDFYQKRHQVIFQAIARLISNGEPADIITVFDFLESKGMAESVGGLQYLGLLAKDTPSTANIGNYAQIVRDKSTLRQLIGLAGEIRQAATDPAADAKQALKEAERQLFELAQQDLRGKRGFSRLRDVLREVLDRVEANFEAPKNGVLGLSSGFRDLDGFTTGFHPGDLIILAGRPGMGKSSLAMNIAEASALADTPTAVFSLEMPGLQLGQRILANVANVPMRRIIESWKLEDSDWPRLTTGLQKVEGAPLFIDDAGGLSLSDIRARLMRLNMELADEFPAGAGLLVIDYLQLMEPEIDGNRNNQIEEITRGLKRMAKEFGIPIMALSQLNRGLEGRSNKRPIMSDLRDSGSIEQDADAVLFVYRDEVYNQDSPDLGIAEVIIGKQRNGPLGTVRLAFDRENVRFRDLEGYTC